MHRPQARPRDKRAKSAGARPRRPARIPANRTPLTPPRRPISTAPSRHLAQVAELVDAPASGAGVRMGRGGSSPLLGTIPSAAAAAGACEGGRGETIHRMGDLPDGLDLGPVVAIDCETMGLNPHRDRLCVVQLSAATATRTWCASPRTPTGAPNLERMLADPNVLKLFHFGRFDIAALAHRFGVAFGPVYCTKIASKLVRTYTDRHGLRNLLQDLLGVDISKQQQQSSDWGAAKLSRPARLRGLRRAAPAPAEGALDSGWQREGRDGPGRRPVSTSCPTAPGSIWPAGPRSTSSPIRMPEPRLRSHRHPECRPPRHGHRGSRPRCCALGRRARRLRRRFDFQRRGDGCSRTGRVIVSGIGKSGHVARKIAATLASTGTPGHFVHPAEASHGDLGMLANRTWRWSCPIPASTPELADVIAHASASRHSADRHGRPPESTLLRSPGRAAAARAPEACSVGLSCRPPRPR